MKHILVINYTQSGQLNEILDRLKEPLFEINDVTIEHVHISPEQEFPFPWTNDAFWGEMPRCVLEDGIELKPFALKKERYDVIIFGYQPWFLSVSSPSMAILQHETFKKVLKNTPVITVIGARNMWLNAHESVKNHIANAGGKLVANIPLIDRNTNLVSVITILYWMTTGKKERLWGIFPYPGVHQKDIEEVIQPAELICTAVENNQYDNLQQDVYDLGLTNITTSILFIEERAKKIFEIWANLIRKKGTTERKRMFWVTLFKYYLLIALFVVSPILLLLYKTLILPFTMNSVKRKKMYFYGLKD